MFFIKINDIIQECYFDKKLNALQFILDNLLLLDICDNPISELKESRREQINGTDIIYIREYTYTIFKMYKYTKCCICYEQVLNTDKMQCNHSICEKCLYKIRKNECPLCRKSLKGKTITINILQTIKNKEQKDKEEEEEHQRELAELASYGVDINELY